MMNPAQAIISSTEDHQSHELDPMEGITGAGAPRRDDAEQRIMYAIATLKQAVDGGFRGIADKLPAFVRDEFARNASGLVGLTDLHCLEWQQAQS